MSTAQFIWSAAIIAAATICTALTRWLPFLLFGGKRPTPRVISYLGQVLPAAIIAILILYCLRSISFVSLSGFAPQLIAVLVTAILHISAKNTLVSIAGGTVCYMILIRTLFPLI